MKIKVKIRPYLKRDRNYTVVQRSSVSAISNDFLLCFDESSAKDQNLRTLLVFYPNGFTFTLSVCAYELFLHT